MFLNSPPLDVPTLNRPMPMKLPIHLPAILLFCLLALPSPAQIEDYPQSRPRVTLGANLLPVHPSVSLWGHIQLVQNQKKGTFSGTLRFGTRTVRFAGRIENGDFLFRQGRDFLPEFSWSEGTLSISPEFTAELLTKEDELLRGTLVPAYFDLFSTLPSALLNRGNAGLYTLALLPLEQTPPMESEDYPQGAGYAQIRLAKNGLLRAAIVFPDGGRATIATPISQDLTALFYAQFAFPGGNRQIPAQFLSTLEFTTEAPVLLESAETLWSRPAIAALAGTSKRARETQLFTKGWPRGIELEALGAAYNPADNLRDLWQLPDPPALHGNAWWKGRAFAGDSILALRNIAVLPRAITKSIPTDRALDLRFAANTGLFRGSIDWTAAESKNRQAFTGIVIQHGPISGGHGFYLAAPGSETGAGSGAVEIEPHPADAIPGFCHIPESSFDMGDLFSEGDVNERPARTVTVGSFHLERSPVTYFLWHSVHSYAVANGYTDLPWLPNLASRLSHPVVEVTWFDAIKWCNARSERDGLQPVYYADEALTEILRTGSPSLKIAHVNWMADGYRLPTEAEWEKAARGGVSGLRFPWGRFITHAWANYLSNGNSPYDSSKNTRNTYHPATQLLGEPRTLPPGTFPANGFGLYDMIGNVWEWCWDRTDGGSLETGGVGVDNPKGMDPGTGAGKTNLAYRVLRGGSWRHSALHQRVSYRNYNNPTFSNDNIGFRTARSSE